MLGALRETAVRLLPRSTAEYVYTTDIIKYYPLGFHTRDSAVVEGVNLYIQTQQHFPPDTDSFRHAFGVHRADCERINNLRITSVLCDADDPNGNCWEGVVEFHR